MSRDTRRGEFETIARFFAPLASNEPGAFGLKDDAAIIKPANGHELVVTTDAIVEGVHFLKDDPPGTIAQKALRVNLSDLAAKGATPRAYLLTAVLPPRIDEAWLKAFASGLKRDQAQFGITLIGGDTVSTPGPLTLNIVVLGEVPDGKMIRRAGAKAGDDVWVTGTIGDAALGLRLLRGEDIAVAPRERGQLIARYRVPEPRVTVGLGLRGLSHACLDVSDGLAADLAHIADTSGLRIEIDLEAVPHSRAAAAAVAAKAASPTDLLTAGDDYELAFTAPVSARARIEGIAAKTKVKLTKIGRAAKGQGLTVQGSDGEPLALGTLGFTHF